jgi:ArsR family transcriptional regulator
MYENSIAVFKCLADKSRLRIIDNLLNEPMYVELLAERLDLTPSTVSFHLKKLEACGLVSSKKEQYYVMYHVNKDLFSATLLSMVQTEQKDVIEEKRQQEYKDKIFKAFMKNGRIIQIPVQLKKRLVLWEEILKCFEKDREYKEREVNIIIADFNDDFCTIRREMVGEGMFTRDKGIYKRTDKYD